MVSWCSTSCSWSTCSSKTWTTLASSCGWVAGWLAGWLAGVGRQVGGCIHPTGMPSSTASASGVPSSAVLKRGCATLTTPSFHLLAPPTHTPSNYSTHSFPPPSWQHMYPELGVELPERQYGAECRLYIPGQGINWKVGAACLPHLLLAPLLLLLGACMRMQARIRGVWAAGWLAGYAATCIRA